MCAWDLTINKKTKKREKKEEKLKQINEEKKITLKI